MFVPFYSATMLAFESCGVVGLRMAMLMTGSRECVLRCCCHGRGGSVWSSSRLSAARRASTSADMRVALPKQVRVAPLGLVSQIATCGPAPAIADSSGFVEGQRGPECERWAATLLPRKARWTSGF